MRWIGFILVSKVGSGFLLDVSVAQRFSQRPCTATIAFIFDVSLSLPWHLVFPTLTFTSTPFPGHSSTPKNECIGRILARGDVSTSGERHQRGGSPTRRRVGFDGARREQHDRLTQGLHRSPVSSTPVRRFFSCSLFSI